MKSLRKWNFGLLTGHKYLWNAPILINRLFLVCRERIVSAHWNLSVVFATYTNRLRLCQESVRWLVHFLLTFSIVWLNACISVAGLQGSVGAGMRGAWGRDPTAAHRNAALKREDWPVKSWLTSKSRVSWCHVADVMWCSSVLCLLVALHMWLGRIALESDWQYFKLISAFSVRLFWFLCWKFYSAVFISSLFFFLIFIWKR